MQTDSEKLLLAGVELARETFEEFLVELDWTLCAWCGKDFERPEVVAPVYMPGPRPQIEGQAPLQVDGPPRQPILAPGMLGPEMSPARER